MNTRMTPKDFFLHLGATIVLYATAIALINLVFSVINYFVPDQLAGYFHVNSVIWPISMLIVLIPLLYVLEWLTNRDIGFVPEKREIWIRRWRIYLTLFLAGAAIVGDLITLINTYLNGEISGRFVYKVLAVFIISVVIFIFYLLELSAEPKRNTRKTIATIGIIVAIAAIFAGFVTVGSPAKQRAFRFDDQRVNDLTNIQWQIINYWQKKGTIPKVLSELNNDIANYSVPKDPVTKTDYEYSTTGKTTFQLCASFALESQDLANRGANRSGEIVSVAQDYYVPGNSNDSWNHKAGKNCFERTIDPERYPVKPNAVY